MKRAFTLLEILVTVGLVSILVTLTIPAVLGARARTSQAISAHSLHELMVAGTGYLAENNNTFWTYVVRVPEGVQWWFGLEPNESTTQTEGNRFIDYSKGPLGPYTMSASNIKTDPAFLQYGNRLKPKFKDGNYGYGYNTELALDSRGYANPRNALQIADPGQVVIFVTSAQVNTFQAPASSGKPMIEEFYMVNNKELTVHFRHNRCALAAFLDGSVRPLSMDEAMSSQDGRLKSACIGRLKTAYVKQDGW